MKKHSKKLPKHNFQNMYVGIFVPSFLYISHFAGEKSVEYFEGNLTLCLKFKSQGQQKIVCSWAFILKGPSGLVVCIGFPRGLLYSWLCEISIYYVVWSQYRFKTGQQSFCICM